MSCTVLLTHCDCNVSVFVVAVVLQVVWVL